MKLGIVGLPNVGKSTLFNSLTKAGAESANYPFCTIDPNVGVVTVPDERLKLLGDFYHSKKVTPAVIEFVDIAGLVKGASKGEGLGNQFLANIREVDAIVHVVRCFEDSNVIHVDGSIDPIRDIETINLELIFSDLEILERRIAKVTKTARMDKEAAKELDFLQKVKTHLEDGKMAITMEMENEDEEAWMSTYNLLTWKPVIYAANVAEGDLADDGESNSHVQAVRKYAAEQNSEIFVICAEIEEEISGSVLFSNCLKCFIKILNDIVNILCTNGKTNCIWFDTLIEKFFFCALAVCCCSRMDNKRFNIRYIGKQ